MSTNGRLSSIDALRGLAALAVVLRHVQEQFFPIGLPVPAQTLFQWFGVWGVTLFFVLSGFCIHLPHARARAAAPAYRLDRGAYLRQRFWRIAPPYWTALLLAIVVGAVMPTGVLPGATGLGDIAAHALFVHNLSPATLYSIEGPFWTIAVEVQFYGLYLLIASRRVRLPLVGALLLGALVLYGAASVAIPAGSPWRGAAQHFTLLSFWQWCLGAWLAEVHVRKPSIMGPRWLSPLRLVAIAGSLALCWLGVVVGGAHLNVWLLPLACAAVVFLFADPAGEKRVGALTHVGEASYSLYLLHPVAIAVVAFAVARLDSPAYVACGTAIALSILAAFASFQAIERPMMNLRRRRPKVVVRPA